MVCREYSWIFVLGMMFMIAAMPFVIYHNHFESLRNSPKRVHAFRSNSIMSTAVDTLPKLLALNDTAANLLNFTYGSKNSIATTISAQIRTQPSLIMNEIERTT